MPGLDAGTVMTFIVLRTVGIGEEEPHRAAPSTERVSRGEAGGDGSDERAADERVMGQDKVSRVQGRFGSRQTHILAKCYSNAIRSWQMGGRSK